MRVVLGLLLCLCSVALAEEQVVATELRTISHGRMDEFELETPDWVADLEDDVAFTSFVVRLKDADGNELPPEVAYLHHVLISGRNIRNLACPEYDGYGYIAGSGAEYTDIFLDAPYAMKVSPGDEWQVAVHVVNPSKHDTLEYYMEYIFDVYDWSDEYVLVEGYLNSAAGCASDLDFDVPKDKHADSFIIHADLSSTITGTFIWTAAHLHSSGKNLYFSNSNTGSVLFSAMCHYDNNPDYLSGIDHSNSHYSVSLGEPLRITGVYDCSEAHDGVMAIVFGYLIVDEVYEGETLVQTIGYDNPFVVQVAAEPEPTEESSEINSQSNEEDGGKDNDKEEKEDKAFVGIIAASGAALIVLVAIIVIAAVAILLRIKSKRSVEIFDE